MHEHQESPDPGKRHLARLMELARTDPQIGALRPLAAVRQAACAPGLSCDRVMAAILDGYADRPALGERV